MSASEKYAAARAEADAGYVTEWRAAQDAPTLAEASEAARVAERKRTAAWQAAAAQYRADQAAEARPAWVMGSEPIPAWVATGHPCAAVECGQDGPHAHPAPARTA